MRLGHPIPQVLNMHECRKVREPKFFLDTFGKILSYQSTNNYCYAVNNGLSAGNQK